MNEVMLSTKQAQSFAQAIYTDIALYIEEHQEEYQKFLSEMEEVA